MIMLSMDYFQEYCKGKLVNWYNDNHISDKKICMNDVFVVWSCKTLQNYKALLSTTVSDDGIYVEYTYNGDKRELYQDVYKKINNTAYTE